MAKSWCQEHRELYHVFLTTRSYTFRQWKDKVLPLSGYSLVNDLVIAMTETTNTPLNKTSGLERLPNGSCLLDLSLGPSSHIR